MVRNPILEVMLLDNNEPTSYGEAMVGPNSDKWLESMKSEIGSMYQNKAWTLVDLPDDRQAIEINGSLRRRRTWTVMSPSMKLDLWRRVFSQVQVRRNHVSISCIYEIWQIDVKTSFLTSFRKERLYVIQSERFCRS